MGRSAAEMENHVFMKAQSREEYMALVAKLILHIKEYNRNRTQQVMSAGAIMGAAGHMSGSGQHAMTDGRTGLSSPMNAFETLARQGGGQPPPQQGIMPRSMQPTAQPRQIVQPRTPVQQTQRQHMQFQPGNAAMSAPHQNQYGGPVSMGVQQPYGQVIQPSMQHESMGFSADSSPMPQSSPVAGLASPSPGSNVAPSPGSRGKLGVLSPGAFLNTPGNQIVQTSSPGMSLQASSEEQMYLEKLHNLSRFMEPLHQHLNNLEKNTDEESKKQKVKMKSLLDVLTNTNKRVSMQTLLRCESALNNWNLSNHKQGMFGQPLYDAIAANVTSPTLNHSLQRSFGSSMSAFLGSGIKRSHMSDDHQTKKDGIVEEENGLSLTLQREIANLGVRFCVLLDPLYPHSNNTIHLVCKLDDVNLPTIPPALVTIPEDYPCSSPTCNLKACPGYDSSNFYVNVAESMSGMLQRMSHYSLTSLLVTWEMSIRKACKTLLGPPTNLLNLVQ